MRTTTITAISRLACAAILLAAMAFLPALLPTPAHAGQCTENGFLFNGMDNHAAFGTPWFLNKGCITLECSTTDADGSPRDTPCVYRLVPLRAKSRILDSADARDTWRLEPGRTRSHDFTGANRIYVDHGNLNLRVVGCRQSGGGCGNEVR